MNLYLDMDGIVFDFNSQCRKYLGVDDEPTDYYHWNEFANFKEIMRQESFWSEMPLYPWAQELVSLKRDFKFCSSAFAGIPESYSGKSKAVCKHFGSCSNLILIQDKSLLANRESILVDDRDDNLSAFHFGGGTGIAWPQLYNVARKVTVESTISRIKEIL